VLILSADHGVCPLPEVAKEQGKDAGRIVPAEFLKAANTFLGEKYSEPDEKTRCLDALMDSQLYLNRAWLKAKNLDQDKVEEALATWAKKQPGVQTAYTRTQLLGDIPANDAIGQRVKESFFEKRSGDVFVVTKPYYLFTKYTTGTTHGTPHPYDTHVPLLAMGPGIKSGARKDTVTPQVGALILSRALGIKPPKAAEATLPDNVFRN
jgi:hypothetical protein